MNQKAEADAEQIWSLAKQDGKARYFKGRSSHKTDLWTAGAMWYAHQAREESLDGVAYHHHLKRRLQAISEAAQRLLNGDITRTVACKLILSQIHGEPKKLPFRRTRE